MKKTFAIFAALFIAAGLLHFSAATIIKRPACGSPCHWDVLKGEFTCAPLQASLEIKTTPEPLGHGIVTWYRATVKNNSCETISLESGFFGRNQGLTPAIRLGRTRIEVVDPSGKILPEPRDIHQSAAGDLEKDVHPYIEDTSIVDSLAGAMNRLIADRFSSIEDFVPLVPNTELTASPDLLKPYRLTAQSVETKDYLGTAIVPEQITIKDPEKLYAPPPPGFRKLGGYKFKNGVYTVRFIVQEKANVQFFENPATPIMNRVRRILRFAADAPYPEFGWFVDVNIKSDPMKLSITH